MDFIVENKIILILFFIENKLPFGEDKIIRFICVVLMRWNFPKIVYV